MGIIYKIISPTNKVYVGKTYDLRKRINSHKCTSKQGKNIILHNSIRKYGWDAHKLEVIEEIEDDLLNEREIFWIDKLKTYCYENSMGMNMTKGADGQRSTWMHKTELRKYFSDKFSGSGNPFFGKTHSEEYKKNKAKEVSEYNKTNGVVIPKWGVEKGRLQVIRGVLCYDKYGNFLMEYDSLTEASILLEIKTSAVYRSCRDKSSGVNGIYIFRYTTPAFPLKIEVREINSKSVKRVVLYLSSNGAILKEYPSALEASKDLFIPKGTINRAACYNNMRPIRTGHIFIYKDLYEKQNISLMGEVI